MKKVLFYCGVNACPCTGTLEVSEADWSALQVQHLCPVCGILLDQRALHFEDLNFDLQVERWRMCQRRGPLTLAERRRLRVIHAALNQKREQQLLTPDEEDRLIARTSSAMQFTRNQMLS